MKQLAIVLGFALALAACAQQPGQTVQDMPATGTDVTVQKKDGVTVAGRLVEAKPEQVVIESRDGVKMEVPRSQIASIKAAAPAADERRDVQAKAAAGATGEAPGAPSAPRAPVAPKPDDTSRAAKTPEFREVTIPAGTTLSLTLGTAIGSDTSKVEDPVRATLRAAVSAEGVEALPSGTAVLGHVTTAERSGKVKGRASIGVRFNAVELPGDAGRESITTATVTRAAETTKKKDATKIGIGAGAGAVVGGILGGGGGAAKGAAIGGGAGTAAVLATRGDEVRLAAGTPLSVKLTAPLSVRVPAK